MFELGLVLAGISAFPVALLVHELGHAFAALLLGEKVSRIEIGLRFWPRLRFEVMGCKFLVSPYMLCGWIYPKFKHEQTWWRTVLFSLGGPLANLLISLVLVGLWQSNVGGDNLLVALLDAIEVKDVVPFAIFFHLLGAVGTALNLIPLPGYDGSRALWAVVSELTFQLGGNRRYQQTIKMESWLESYANLVDACVCLAMVMTLIWFFLFLLLPVLRASI